MFNFILRNSIKYRYFILFTVFLLIIFGFYSYRKLVIDAVPDITNVQVQVNVEAQGYSPYEVEQRITIPLEITFAGIPSLNYTRSLSRYGLAQVTVVFKDGTDIYFARQLVSQRIQDVQDKLPDGISPTMGPISTGLGEIYMYSIESDPSSDISYSFQELREIQDWLIKPQLVTVPGVAEINSIGGASKQIIVTPNIDKIISYGLTLKEVSNAIQNNNMNVGAGFIEHGGEQFIIRVPSQIENLSELSEIVVGTFNNKPIEIKDVANVEIGSELRQGAATEDGKEIVLGTVFMLLGENGREISNRVNEKMIEIRKSLPEGIIIKPMYDRSVFVNSTISTVRNNLLEGSLLVIAILFLALGNIRAALITACVIPLSMLITISGMVQNKLSANLMSFGALDFGLIVDGAVILVENCVKRLGQSQVHLGRILTKEERLKVVYEAASEVRQATMFGELIIMIVYVPILALSGIEGKMFQPMAITVLLALGAAFILSLTFVPAAVAVFVTGKVGVHVGWLEKIQIWYKQLLTKVLIIPYKIMISVAAFFVAVFVLFLNLGSEFIPSLDEGDIALHAIRIPGTSLQQSIEMQYQLERAIKTIPEISHVFTRIGTDEIAADPMPPSIADAYIIVKARSEWPNPKKSKHELITDLEKVVIEIPGNNYEVTQPIQMRFNELIAGVRSDIAIKIFGDNTDMLLEQAQEVREILEGINGASGTNVEQMTGLPMIVIKPNKAKISRLGLSAVDVQDAIRISYAGTEVSKFYEGDRNFPIIIRLSEVDRTNIDEIKNLPISLPAFVTSKVKYVRLEDVADILVTTGPNQISRENGKRRIIISTNVRGRDLGSFVEEAQSKIDKQFQLKPNYWMTWSGQYQNLLSARQRLMIVVPLVLSSVFGLTFFTFHSFKYALLVFTGIPFALTGGVIALWVRGIPFSISAAVGFIALSGVSVLNGLVLVSFIRKLISEGIDLTTAVTEGAVSRLRPVLMTALVASLGFVPMAISQGTGSEVQRPLATVVIGGILSSTALTLLVLPVLIHIFGKRKKS